MTSISHHFLFLLILSLRLSLTFSELANIFTDLTTDSFTNPKSQWICSNNLGTSLVSSCGSYHILGGPGIFGASAVCSINLSLLDPHYSMYMSFTFLKINVWQSETFLISIDSEPKKLLTFQAFDDASVRICPTTTTQDAIRAITLNVSHSQPSLSVSFSSNISQNEGFWGLRSLMINIDTCHSTCTLCEGPSSTQCTACGNNARLSLEGACVCNEGFFLKILSSCVGWRCSSCEPCQFNCKTCFGDTINSCLSCVKGSFFTQNSCVGEYECPSGYYADWDASQCKICQANCGTCEKTATFCTSCKNPYFLQDSSCVTSCVDGYFGAVNGRVCLKCSDSCSTCSLYAWNCTSCPMFSGVYLTKQGTCLTYCPSGYWKNSATFTCDKCSENCATCESSSTFCKSCRFPLYLSLNNCVSTCPDSYFYEEVPRKCTLCDKSCLRCARISMNCTACPSPKVFQANKCLDECSSGFYQENSGVSPICLPCDSSCLSCTFSSSYCSSCNSPKVLTFSAKCEEACPAGQFNSKGVCKECNEICSVCQENAEYCLQCADPQLFANEGTCVDACPGNTYTYLEKRQCLTCNELCNGCFGAEKFQCLGCFANKFLYKHECLDLCPNSTFVQGGTCQPCGQKFCVFCENEQICEVCEDDYYLNSSKMCQKKQLVIANFSNIENPFAFRLNFNYSFLEKDLEELAKNSGFSIKNQENVSHSFSSFNTFLQSSCIYFELIFSETIEKTANFLTISLKTPENATFTLQIENSSQELRPFAAICDQKLSFYDFSAEVCRNKRMIDFFLQYSADPRKYYLETSGLTAKERENASNLFLFSSNYTDFTYNINSDSSNTLLINLVFFSDVLNGPLLKITEDFPLDYVFSEHVAFKTRETSIKLRDFYNASLTELKITQSASEMMSFSDIFNEINFYLNIILSGDSSFLIQGLMLLNLVDFLRFTSVNYPMNLNTLFSAKSANKDMFGIGNIAVDAENARDLPDNFALYGISPYFLNNTASLFVQLALILTVVGFLKALWTRKTWLRRLKYAKTLIKALKVLKRVFIWMVLFNFLFSKYQYFILFTFLGLKFTTPSTTNSRINLFFAVLSMVFFVFLPVHVYFLIRKVCQTALFHRKSQVLPTRIQETCNISEKKHEEKEVLPSKDSENIVENEKTLRSPYRFRKNLKILTRLQREEIAISPVDLGFRDPHDTKIKEQWSAVLQENDSEMTNCKKNEEKLEFNEEINEINEGIEIEKKVKEGEIDEKLYKGLSFFFRGNFSSLNDNAPPQTDCDSKRPIFKEKPTEFPQNIAKTKDKTQKKLTKGKIFEFFAKISVKCPPCLQKLTSWAYFFDKSQEKRVVKRLGFLAKDFKHKKKAQNLYIFCDFLRHGVLSCFFVVFFEFPLQQLACICTFNLFFFIFLLFSRAYTKKSLMLMTIINESIVNLALFSAFFIAIYDSNQEKNIENRVLCGWIIIFASVFLVYSLVLTTLLKLLGNLYALLVICFKNQRKITKIVPEATKIESFRIE